MFSLFNIDFKKVNAFAHSSGGSLEKEKFFEHCDRTIKYYDYFIDTFSLNLIIKKLISNIDNFFNIEQTIDLIRRIIYFHDIGKLTDKFQQKLDGEKNKETHSDKSFYFIVYLLLNLSFEEKLSQKEFFFFLLISYSVLKHHGKLRDVINEISDLKFSFKKSRFAEISRNLNIEINNEIIEIMEDDFFERVQFADFKNISEEYLKSSNTFYILLKLINSLLISSDYYATADYRENKDFSLNVLNETIIDTIFKNFHNTQKLSSFNNFNYQINQNQSLLRKYTVSEIENLNKSKESRLNILRSKINIEAENRLSDILKNQDNSNVYLLNVPTGGGKTNISMRLALKIMKERNVKKLYYVFPFINIIEQSFESIARFTGEENITRLDSRYISPIENEESNYDEISFEKHIDTLFFNTPVLMMSHVKFFDMIFRNDKNSNYNFFQLANSIVIIDEVQAYNDKVWTEVMTIMNSISEFLNTHFIIMTATLPDLSKLVENAHFHLILQTDFRDKVFNSSLFKRTEILPDPSVSKDNILDRIKKFTREGYKKILIVLNKISDSFNLYEELSTNHKQFYNYEIYLLNSTIPEHRRKRIIAESKNDSMMILISTQSVEAGVDIDFDIGLRAYAPIDSIIQVAGRLNRNSKKDDSKLFVFPDESANNVYKNSSKSSVMKKYEAVFFSKSTANENSLITDFYNQTINEIRKYANVSIIQDSKSNLLKFSNLEFESINNEIKLIDGDTISLYVPYNAEAEDLWIEYCKLFDNKKRFDNYLKIKNFRKKLIPYNIHLFKYYTSKGKLKPILDSEIKYGFYYCKDWEEYFTIETGLNIELFKDIVTSGRGEFL